MYFTNLFDGRFFLKLRNQFSLNCLLKNPFAQGLAQTLKVCISVFRFLNDGEKFVQAINDAVLFGKRWNGDDCGCYFFYDPVFIQTSGCFLNVIL